MKKAYCILFSALLMIACGDDNSSSASDDDYSSSEEVSIESSSDVTNVSSSSEKKDEQESSSSIQKANSSSDKAETSSSVQEANSSSTDEIKSSSSKQIIADFGDNKFVIKQIPTFGKLDGKPYFYTMQPRCIYKNGVFTLKPDTSDNAYFYAIANDTLTLNHVDLDKVLAGTYEEPSAKETYYGKNPQEFFDHIYAYRLGEKFDFDLDGLGTPVVNRPGTRNWSRTTLGTTAYGYGMSVTPLHVVTFYNAIANKGRMMKPYVVESVEKDGKVVKQYGPSVLNNICSRATADTVTRALKAVVEDGTATRLKNAKLSVAGKTGTAQVVLTPQERKGSADPYHDPWGRKKNQGTFVGFFPAENPKYTILVTVYSYLSGQSFYGGTKPALAVRDIVDGIYAIDDAWSGRIAPSGTLPRMESRIADASDGKAPDLKGFGLMDALYAVENGHVTAQSPAPGTALKKGETIRLTLK